LRGDQPFEASYRPKRGGYVAWAELFSQACTST